MSKKGPTGRCVRDAADARELLQAVAESSESLYAWCHHNGVSSSSLYHWRGRLAREENRASLDAISQIPLSVVEVAVGPAPAEPPPSSYIVRREAWAVEVPANFEEGVLARLLQVVSSC